MSTPHRHQAAVKLKRELQNWAKAHSKPTKTMLNESFPERLNRLMREGKALHIVGTSPAAYRVWRAFGGGQ